MTIVRCTALATALLLSPMMAAAEVLVIEHTDQTAGMQKPANGMSMADVEARYGSPQEQRAPVGDPPITQWIYSDFVVYFEHNLTIHSVTKRAPSK